MNYNIFTLGCQQNVHDSIRLKFVLDKLGFTETSENKAQVIFVVACSVRQKAVDRIFGKLKKWGLNKKVLITACVLVSDMKKFKSKGAIFFDISDLNPLREHLGINYQVDLNIISGQVASSSFIPVMTGCNNFCSYCAVPYTRGRETSRPIDEIVNDLKHSVSAGNREITLLGQNVNSYAYGFDKLLKKLNDIDDNFTIKFLTNHPKDMTASIISAIASLPKVVKEIHLPLQSGSTKILKAMNRKYTKEDYLKLIADIKKEIPNVKIGTDIIVGFPGETEKDFENTLDVVKFSNFHQGFVSMYSPRPGTAAAKMLDDVPLETKKSRFRILDSLINND